MEGKKRVVGLSGGMGAGKSTLVEVVREMGIPVFDYDAQVSAAYDNSEFADYVGSLIGLNPPVTKAMVAQEIVRSPWNLPVVEKAVVNCVNHELLRALNTDPEPFLFIDAPMLFEMNWHEKCDFTIAVLCPIEERRKRVMSRPGMTIEKMNLLMGRQLSEDQRLWRSDFVIENTGTIEEARDKMRDTINRIKEIYTS